MFQLRTPKALAQTDIQFDPAVLSAGHCGLYRAPLHLAAGLMPEMRELIESVPRIPRHQWDQYEIDIKVHMLMAGQYPCIPNWHTDMVPRGPDGLRFDLIKERVPEMLLWISDGPETEFLARPLEMPETPKSHHDLAHFIKHGHQRLCRVGWVDQGPPPMTQFIQPNVWWSMDQQTPHRGTRAKKAGWRVFARVVHRSLAPAGAPASVIRRHAQVYLDAAEFGW